MGIKTAREKVGMTQARVAQLVGVKQSAVAQWESGNVMPRADKLVLLSKVLKCSIKKLLQKENADANDDR